MYIAVIGDLVDSRGITDRRAVQEDLRSILEDINQTFRTSLASSFSLTLGDEFQGVLHTPEGLLELLFRIKFSLWPVKVRFGVGLGDISTRIDPAQSIGADGPAYHTARRMITEVKRLEAGKKARQVDLLLGHAGGAECLDALNAGLCLLHFLESGWTRKQRDNVWDSLFGGLNQSEIALKRGLNQSTVHRSLTSSGYYEYEMAFQEFQLQLNRIWREIQ